MSAQLIPTSASELEALVRLWEREAALSQSALLLDCDEVDMAEVMRRNAVQRLITTLMGPVILTSRERRLTLQRPSLAFEIQRPTVSEQRTLWRATLGPAAVGLNGLLETLVSQFSLSAQTIHEISAEALARTQQSVGSNQSSVSSGQSKRSGEPALTGQQATGNLELADALWETCRMRARRV
jgi:hypothetical protein